MKKIFYFVLGMASLMMLHSCNLERPIDIKLPPYESKLVVECYVENGKPYQLALTESVAYLAAPTLPIVSNASVSISNQNQSTVLNFFPLIDSLNLKAYNYVSASNASFKVGDELSLNIIDALKNRTLTGTATVLPPPVINSISATFNDKNQAYLLIRFPDNDPNAKNYYRLVVNKDSLKNNPINDFFFEGRISTNNEISLSTGFNYNKNDTLILSLYHIEKKYYDFLDTSRDAARANGNPFAQPSSVLNTVQGGMGVFTVLSYQRKKFIVKKEGLVYLPL